MKDKNDIKFNILKTISNFGWFLYKMSWYKNPRIKRALDNDTRDNLGYYLCTGTYAFQDKLKRLEDN